jgi:hypothetical protein
LIVRDRLIAILSKSTFKDPIARLKFISSSYGVLKKRRALINLYFNTFYVQYYTVGTFSISPTGTACQNMANSIAKAWKSS